MQAVRRVLNTGIMRKMHLILIVFLFIASFSCDVTNTSKDMLREDEDLPFCKIDVDINDKSWDEYHPKERSATYSSSRVRLITSRDVTQMRFVCTRYYDSYYRELLLFYFEISPDEDIVEWADNEDKLVPDRVTFGESKSDFGVSRYPKVDTTQTHYVNIKEIDYDEMIMRAEFEFTLIVSDSFLEPRSGRYPDTLRFSGGKMSVKFEDMR